MAAAELFWETDSECECIEDDEGLRWAVDDASGLTPREPVLKRRRIRHPPELLATVNRRPCPPEWGEALDKIFELLKPEVGIAHGAPAKNIGGAAPLAVTDYHATQADIRARLDVGVYTSPSSLEADVLSMLLNTMVLYPVQHKVHTSAKGVLVRLQGILEGYGLPQSVATRRLAGRQVAPEGDDDDHSHAVAHARILQKFIMLDHQGHFATSSGQGGDYAADTLQGIKDNFDNGLYATDLDLELELRALFLTKLVSSEPSCDEWKESRRLLGLVTKAFEDNGLQAQCRVSPPVQATFLTDAELKDCQQCIDILRSVDKDSLFTTPVERVPRYRRVIRRPMDVTTLQMRLDRRLYISPRTFLQDVFLVIENCKCFNPHPSSYHGYACDVEKQLRKRIQKATSLLDGAA